LVFQLVYIIFAAYFVLQPMTDQEIIKGLIEKNNEATRVFFFERCQPLFRKIINVVFSYEVDYDEFVNELYIYLMDNDAAILRRFQYRCSVYQWLKVIAIRFFIKKRDQLIEDSTHETLYDRQRIVVSPAEVDTSAELDIERLFSMMPNQRYVHVIRKLILEDWEPEKLAREMNITTANLYNIKRRAMAQLTRAALKDKSVYGK